MKEGIKVFFFKQKTAYEIMPSLVGSEMCIRDRYSIIYFFGKCYNISLCIFLHNHYEIVFIMINCFFISTILFSMIYFPLFPL
ncbi:hypothetical protein BN3590_01534 [Clostridium sp. C105KSO15]|nr:hypothetical protein BN3590_01534 [Clostridium sp. C105KSO15]